MTTQPSQTSCILRDGAEIVLRNGVEQDAEALLSYVDDLLRDGDGQVRCAHEEMLTPELERQWIRDLDENPNGILLLAKHGQELVGNIDFRTYSRQRLAHTGVFGMAVAPAWRGRGVGTALLTTFLEWAATRPVIEKISLIVLADNKPAISLYNRLGFVEEGRRKNEVKREDGTYVDDILMCIFLK